MWKLKIFSVAQILREINFRKARSSEIAAFCHFMGFELCPFSKFQPSKSAKIHKNENSEPPNVLKWQIRQLKMSHKIWVL